MDPEIHVIHTHFSKSQDWTTLLVQQLDPVKTLAGLLLLASSALLTHPVDSAEKESEAAAVERSSVDTFLLCR